MSKIIETKTIRLDVESLESMLNNHYGMNGNISFEYKEQYVGSGDFREPGHYRMSVESIVLTETRNDG